MTHIHHQLVKALIRKPNIRINRLIFPMTQKKNSSCCNLHPWSFLSEWSWRTAERLFCVPSSAFQSGNDKQSPEIKRPLFKFNLMLISIIRLEEGLGGFIFDNRFHASFIWFLCGFNAIAQCVISGPDRRLFPHFNLWF